jgi:hypothetical protein
MNIAIANVKAFVNHTKALKLDDTTFIRLRSFETRAHHLAEMYCNGFLEGEEYEKIQGRMAKAINKLIPHLTGQWFFNGDPRGYALKLKEESSKNYIGAYRDWGGYVILAPEF